jgi:hypothetical protein
MDSIKGKLAIPGSAYSCIYARGLYPHPFHTGFAFVSTKIHIPYHMIVITLKILDPTDFYIYE